MRRALIVAIVIAARAAHADPCGPPDPIDATPRAMSVALAASADGWTRTLAPGASSQFPAVSEDGTVIVELLHDHADSAGQPLATAVFFARGQRAASIALTSDATPTASRAQRRLERRAVAEINDRLARARWRPLAVAHPCELITDTSWSAQLGDGVELTLFVGGEVVVRAGNAVHETLQVMPVGNGTCGRAIRIDHASATGAHGFVVVVPRFETDDGRCGGMTSAELAMPVLIP